ncbi:hypothetical protein SteCoe_30501 [Stentor coeruleus]|uniref:Uncharacterized protein n=1 Tax=Stentor coeruleus TaxID=5963 RepID=A0A1R2B3F0_9CILI|nr:hypothetical protein SteCoe_30501 [Stentor coeruleus]
MKEYTEKTFQLKEEIESLIGRYKKSKSKDSLTEKVQQEIQSSICGILLLFTKENISAKIKKETKAILTSLTIELEKIIEKEKDPLSKRIIEKLLQLQKLQSENLQAYKLHYEEKVSKLRHKIKIRGSCKNPLQNKQLSEIYSYISLISEQNSSNLSIVHANLFELQSSITNLFKFTRESLFSFSGSMPSDTLNNYFSFKQEVERSFSQISKFIDQFIKTLTEFSRQYINFDKFSEIPVNSSSLHEICEEDIRPGNQLLIRENDILKEQIDNYEEKIAIMENHCEELQNEVASQRKTVRKLVAIMEKMKQCDDSVARYDKKGEENEQYFDISTAFQHHLTALRDQVEKKEGKIRELEEKGNSINDFKPNKKNEEVILSAKKEVEDIKLEFRNLKLSVNESLNGYICDIQNFLTEIPKKVLKLNAKPDEETKIHIQELIENNESLQKQTLDLKESFKAEVKMLNIESQNLKTKNQELNNRLLKITESLESYEKTFKCLLNVLPIEQNTQNSLVALKNYVLLIHKVVSTLSVEFEEVDPKNFIEKLSEIKYDRDEFYMQAQKVSGILTELQDYTGLKEGQLLGFMQSSKEDTKNTCQLLMSQFNNLLENLSSSALNSLSKLSKKLASLEEKLKNDSPQTNLVNLE